jgi:serine/threonine protein kinase
MEYCNRGSLDTWLRKRLTSFQGRPTYLTSTEIVSLAIQLTGGLEELHGVRLTHGDIAPRNIFISAAKPKHTTGNQVKSELLLTFKFGNVLRSIAQI